jgi:hypothetical protein
MMFKSFLGVYPVEDTSSVTLNQWTDYFACIIKVSSADGFSEKEKESLKYYLNDMGLPSQVLDDAAGLSKKSFEELLPSETLREVLAPYIIRDALHISHSDGELSEQEESSLREMAAAIGFSAQKADAVLKSIRLYHEAVDEWKKAIE